VLEIKHSQREIPRIKDVNGLKEPDQDRFSTFKTNPSIDHG
jgi:hypothetical protein